MKRKLAWILCVVLRLTLFAGCERPGDAASSGADPAASGEPAATGEVPATEE